VALAEERPSRYNFRSRRGSIPKDDRSDDEMDYEENDENRPYKKIKFDLAEVGHACLAPVQGET